MEGPLTARLFFQEVGRRVFRFDKSFAFTAWRMLHAPGPSVRAWQDGRRSGYVDPIHYFISSLFVQVAVAALIEIVAPPLGRHSALAWLAPLVGMVVLKIFAIFWMGALWRIMYRPEGYNLAQIYEFALYALGTTGLLWAVLPLVDVLVPYPLGSHPRAVTLVTFVVEITYMTFAIWQFGKIRLWRCILRVCGVLIVTYWLLLTFGDAEHATQFLLPTLNRRT